jgi:hypothetical protein
MRQTVEFRWKQIRSWLNNCIELFGGFLIDCLIILIWAMGNIYLGFAWCYHRLHSFVIMFWNKHKNDRIY